jgi:hypothetical protein
MLAFLIGTSILNIFLGYALAVYLMRESLTLENHRGSANLSKSPEPAGGSSRGQSDLYPPSDSPFGSTTAPRGEQPPTANESSNAANSGVSGPSGDEAAAADGGVDRNPDELDQQLLAGIADFRSQLAKLRAEPNSDEPKRRPVGRPAAK